jgi:hypothetical protein
VISNVPQVHTAIRKHQLRRSRALFGALMPAGTPAVRVPNRDGWRVQQRLHVEFRHRSGFPFYCHILCPMRRLLPSLANSPCLIGRNDHSKATTPLRDRSSSGFGVSRRLRLLVIESLYQVLLPLRRACSANLHFRSMCPVRSWSGIV